MSRTTRTSLFLAASGAALVLTLAGCSDTGATSTANDAADSSQSGKSGSSDAASDLTVSDPWVKATEESMTGAFATFANAGDSDLVITGAATSVAGMVELHETVQNADGSMAMQPRAGGFVVPAGGSLTLAPGAEHIMLMGLDTALESGTTVTIELTLDDGSTTSFDATVKAFDGADEQYQREG